MSAFSIATSLIFSFYLVRSFQVGTKVVSAWKSKYLKKNTYYLSSPIQI